MDQKNSQSRLSDIATHYSKLMQADRKPCSQQERDLRAELLRYYGAVYRYLVGMVRNPEAAQELANHFAERFLRGDFSPNHPERGRFRDFLKVALRHMVIDYWRKQKKHQVQPLPAEDFLPPEADDGPPFETAWQEELLAQTWKALASHQEETGQPFYTVLRFKTDHPALRSPDMATQLRHALAKPLTDAAVRQILHRARELFKELLLDEVRRSLHTTDLARVEEELIELKLLDYCKSALKRRQDKENN